MNEKAKFYYRLFFGAVVIAGVIFLSYRYLFKGPPFVKVMAVGLIAAVSYLVVNFIRKRSNNNF